MDFCTPRHLLTIILLLMLPISIMGTDNAIASSTYSVTRKTSHTSLSFETVMSNLYTSIGQPTALKWPFIGANIKSFDEASRERFVRGVGAAVGPEGFMIFVVCLPAPNWWWQDNKEFSHGSWLPLFNINSNPQLGLKRIILGNPLVALTMLSQSSKSLNAGLFVPVEILVCELPGGEGTEIMWQVPSTMIAAVDEGNNGLLAAAEVLDRKLEELIVVIGGGA